MPEAAKPLPLRFWRVWSAIDTASNLPAWWRYMSPLFTGAATIGLPGWTARATHWPLPVILSMGIAVFGATIFALNQIGIRAWLARQDDVARTGQNPDDPPVTTWSNFEDDVLTVHVRNHGPADDFTAQIGVVMGLYEPLAAVPINVRWRNHSDEVRLIVTEGMQVLEVLRAPIQQVENEGRSEWRIGPVIFFTPKADLAPHSVRWFKPWTIAQPIDFDLTVTSVKTGRKKRIGMTVTLASDGRQMQRTCARGRQ